jgi:ribonuclease Z
MKVYLLGTGGPEITLHRQGSAVLIEVNDQKLLFDAGRSVLQRLFECSVSIADVTQIFFTHMHSDHIEGLPNLWMTGWFSHGRTRPLDIWGPSGTKRMIDGMREMYCFDLANRIDPRHPPEALETRVTEYSEGVIYERNGVVITAFEVWHDDGNPAFGFRIAHAGRSVVLSGDTTYHENVIQFAQETDLLVHNVIAVSDELAQLPKLQSVLAKLTTPEQAADIFRRTAPRLAVYTHVIKKGLANGNHDSVLIERTRQAGYAGPLEVGLDRMTIDIGESVNVIPPPAIAVD